MAKLIVCIALICVVLASAHRGPNRGGSGNRGRGPRHGSRPGPGGKDQWAAAICANNSGQSFLSQTRQLISNLQANGSYTEVFEERANEFAYLNDASKDALLASNCTGYFSGLNAARNLDREAEKQQRQYERTAGDLFRQIVQSLVGRKGNKVLAGRNDDISSEDD